MFFLLLNFKEQQNQEGRRLLFLNTSSSSRAIKVQRELPVSDQSA